MRARNTQITVMISGMTNDSQKGAVGRCVMASAHMLTSKTMYISGSCRDKATYWAWSSLGLSWGTDMRVRRVARSFLVIGMPLCLRSEGVQRPSLSGSRPRKKAWSIQLSALAWLSLGPGEDEALKTDERAPQSACQTRRSRRDSLPERLEERLAFRETLLVRGAGPCAEDHHQQFITRVEVH